MGKVYLIGAGPGDPGLLTVKGKGILTHCDVVVYDALVSPDILDLVPLTAVKINAGKRRGSHTLLQEDTTALLISLAQTHAVVARLKGGDPFVFGRGGEEMQALQQAGIEVEVVPGVTAGVAVPAYAGIPITHRDHSSSVLFVTGHESAGKYQPSVDWAAIAKAADTLVIYMGIHNLPTITTQLQAGGLSPDTPVAIIRWGTTPQQTTLITTLNQLLEADPDLLKPPAVVVVGHVVGFAAQT
ncbi:MAG: uroporphyrinogen-III C-methyltransferase [Cyanophyceae cyanobacterium]